MEDDREGDAGGHRKREAGEHLLEGDPGVVGEQLPVVPQRLRDVARGGDEEGLEVERIGDHVEPRRQLPGAEQGDDDRERRQPAPNADCSRSARHELPLHLGAHRAAPLSASSARSRAEVKPGGGDGAEPRQGSVPRVRPARRPTLAGRAESTATRSDR